MLWSKWRKLHQLISVNLNTKVTLAKHTADWNITLKPQIRGKPSASSNFHQHVIFQLQSRCRRLRKDFNVFLFHFVVLNVWLTAHRRPYYLITPVWMYCKVAFIITFWQLFCSKNSTWDLLYIISTVKLLASIHSPNGHRATQASILASCFWLHFALHQLLIKGLLNPL